MNPVAWLGSTMQFSFYWLLFYTIASLVLLGLVRLLFFPQSVYRPMPARPGLRTPPGVAGRA